MNDYEVKLKYHKAMTVKDLVEKLNLQVLSGAQGLDREIDGCYVSDLLSDVMGNAESGNVWVTLQTHKNVMAIASLKELACVVLVKGLTASDDTYEQSNEEGIPFLGTTMQTYETVGKIYRLLQD
ncbi:MAG: thiamine biosynthesis protein ThiC [bacterium P3]|nr:MAG: thiamine biosynthesis protein ThiC [bacterium P3]KWW42397.1 MAG: thiamine biosynthesis protein ThiC [bacterium F083]